MPPIIGIAWAVKVRPSRKPAGTTYFKIQLFISQFASHRRFQAKIFMRKNHIYKLLISNYFIMHPILYGYITAPL